MFVACFKTWKRTILWTVAVAFVLQIAVPMALGRLGFENAALWAVWPGLLPIARMTGGFFAGLTPLGYALLFSINTVVYGILILPFAVVLRYSTVRRISHS